MSEKAGEWVEGVVYGKVEVLLLLFLLLHGAVIFSFEGACVNIVRDFRVMNNKQPFLSLVLCPPVRKFSLFFIFC